MPGDEIIVPTKCDDWSLNVDADSGKRFWWNNTYSISVWETTLNIGEPVADIDDDAAWKAFVQFQINYCFKVCGVCKLPEQNEDMFVCCYCGGAVHKECSTEASQEQIAYKPANKIFAKYLRACFQCEAIDKPVRLVDEKTRPKDNVRRAAHRALSLKDEFPPKLQEEIATIRQLAEKQPDSAELLTHLKKAVVSFFQSNLSLSLLKKGRIASKANGIGVVAAQDIPAFTVIGVYPGYMDALSGEQAKIGRPVPKYALMDLNCADFYNDVFVEFADTFAPFINEPNEAETSNCAWIQEPHRVEGRLSIISVRDIKKDDELLIGYGPLYPRTYPFRYDAYAFHPVEGYENPPCYALWYWPTTEEKDAEFVCYVGYKSAEDKYVYWKTKDEVEQD